MQKDWHNLRMLGASGSIACCMCAACRPVPRYATGLRDTAVFLACCMSGHPGRKQHGALGMSLVRTHRSFI